MLSLPARPSTSSSSLYPACFKFFFKSKQTEIQQNNKIPHKKINKTTKKKEKTNKHQILNKERHTKPLRSSLCFGVVDITTVTALEKTNFLPSLDGYK